MSQDPCTIESHRVVQILTGSQVPRKLHIFKQKNDVEKSRKYGNKQHGFTKDRSSRQTL